MKWVLVMCIFGYGESVVPSFTQIEFDDRTLCVNAKNYYEGEGFKKRILNDLERTSLRFDVQCHQKNYLVKTEK